MSQLGFKTHLHVYACIFELRDYLDSSKLFKNVTQCSKRIHKHDVATRSFLSKLISFFCIDPSDCVVTDGITVGEPCIFPFTFGNNSYKVY